MALRRLPPAHLAACGCTQIGQIWIGSAALVPKQDRRQNGGYVRGRAKTLVALRDWAPSASVLGWQSSRLPTEHMPWPMSCRTAALDRPCPRHP